MLIKKFSFKAKDPHAAVAFFVHVIPVWDKLNDEEKEMAKKFLEDPVEGLREILERYEITWYEKLRREAKNPLLKMLVEYVKKKKWLWQDFDGYKHFIWQITYSVYLTFLQKGVLMPNSVLSLEEFRLLKEHLDEVKQEGLGAFLYGRAVKNPKIGWNSYGLRGVLKIYYKIASKALGRKVTPEEKLTFGEALKCIEWFWDYWKNLGILDAEQKGWIYGSDSKYFIWERYIDEVNLRGDFLFRFTEDRRNFERLKECLEELKKKGAEKFLEIKTTNLLRISWDDKELLIYCGLASRVLGREVEPNEELTFEEAYKVISWLSNRWKKFTEGAEKRGWTWKDEKGRKHFIWERHFAVEMNEKAVPLTTRLEKLRKFKGILEELKQEGAEDFLEVRATSFALILWSNNVLYVFNGLASEVFGREVKKYEELTFEEAERIVDFLLSKWESLGLFEAEKRGWFYEDQNGRKHFIWDRVIFVDLEEEEGIFRPKFCSDLERLKKLKNYLGELRQKGAEKFLWIVTFDGMEIKWHDGTLFVDSELASKVLGRKVEPKEKISFEEAEKIVNWLLRRY